MQNRNIKFAERAGGVLEEKIFIMIFLKKLFPSKIYSPHGASLKEANAINPMSSNLNMI